MNIPFVSILIPAYRPDWLDTTIASALAQTHRNFEILISDDCPTEEVRALVGKWEDSRIRYMRNPSRGVPGSNRDHLISESKGSYLKFLFDDDFLMPNSIEILLKISIEYDAKLVFHNRHLVDENGIPINSSTSNTLFDNKSHIVLTREIFAEEIIKPMFNRIGEPSNVLIHASTLKGMYLPFCIGDRRMRFLTDVALYTNIASAGHRIVGTSQFGSAFRKHTQQASNSSFPGFSAAIYEWELLRRWATDKNMMGTTSYANGISQQKIHYQRHVKEFPELEAFIALRDDASSSTLMNKNFLYALQVADCAIAMRILGLAKKYK
jgi:glycosyltransferase involved in cell wall biosynthesis